MIDTGGPNADVKSCYQTRDGHWSVTVKMAKHAGGSEINLTHDEEVSGRVRVEGGKIVGRG